MPLANAKPCAGALGQYQRLPSCSGAGLRCSRGGFDGLLERRRKQQWRCQAVPVPAVEKPKVVAEDDGSSPLAIRKYLTSVGWESAWIDGVTERIVKRQLNTSVDKCKDVIEYLTSLGLTEQQICNMVSLCHTILAHDVTTHVKPVIAFLKKRGVEDLPSLLTQHPRLLDYTVSADKKTLEKGRLRAAVDVVTEKSRKSVKVVVYREGAAFQTAPLSPWKPKDS